MKTFKRWLRWLLMNTVVIGSLVGAVRYDNPALSRVGLLAVWTLFCFSVVLLFALFIVGVCDQQKNLVEGMPKRISVIPRWLDVPVDLFIVGFLVYFGWVISAVAYLIHIVFANSSVSVLQGWKDKYGAGEQR